MRLWAKPQAADRSWEVPQHQHAATALVGDAAALVRGVALDEAANDRKRAFVAYAAAFSFASSSERAVQQFIVYAKYDSAKYPDIKNGMSAKLKIFRR